MPRRTSTSNNWIVATMTAAIALSPIASAHAGSATGAATEWTQLANNAQLIDLLKSSGLQVDNQLTQITQLAEQIQNQLKIYENMLQNTAQLPDHIWGQVENDLTGGMETIRHGGQTTSFALGTASLAAGAVGAGAAAAQSARAAGSSVAGATLRGMSAGIGSAGKAAGSAAKEKAIGSPGAYAGSIMGLANAKLDQARTGHSSPTPPPERHNT